MPPPPRTPACSAPPPTAGPETPVRRWPLSPPAPAAGRRRSRSSPAVPRGAAMPSMISRRDGGSRRASATTDLAAQRRSCRQHQRQTSAARWTRSATRGCGTACEAAVPPTTEAAVATTAVARGIPPTLRSWPETEVRTEIAFDQRCGQQRFALHCTGRKRWSSRRCDRHIRFAAIVAIAVPAATGHRAPRPTRDQHAGGNARRRPEHGNTVRFL